MPDMNTQIKICGLRDADQARRIVELGADYIGVILTKSPRQATMAEVRKIVRSVGGERVVGVFVNATAREINDTVADTGIGIAQLHGEESPEILNELDVPAIKAIRVRNEKWPELAQPWTRSAMGLLLDAYHPNARGGTGEAFNWHWVEDAQREGRPRGCRRIFLAGGLDASNVAQAIEAVHPAAVDASSLLESEPGTKDMDKVAAFIKAVQANEA